MMNPIGVAVEGMGLAFLASLSEKVAMCLIVLYIPIKKPKFKTWVLCIHKEAVIYLK